LRQIVVSVKHGAALRHSPVIAQHFQPSPAHSRCRTRFTDSQIAAKNRQQRLISPGSSPIIPDQQRTISLLLDQGLARSWLGILLRALPDNEYARIFTVFRRDTP